jgi:hypothetical protein
MICRINQLMGVLAAMDEQISSGYYSELRRSADDLFALELQVVPAISYSAERDEYTGLEEFNHWRYSGRDPSWDPSQFGLEGSEICGSWKQGHSIFDGFFPVIIRQNGNWYLTSKYGVKSPEQVHQQINLAEAYGIPIGIAAYASNIKRFTDEACMAPNAVIQSDAETLRRLCNAGNIRVESDGNLCWTYAFVNWRSDDIFDLCDGDSSRLFGFNGNALAMGLIEKDAIVPAYPSYVMGKKIQLLAPGDNQTRLIIHSAQAVGIHFDVDIQEMQPTSDINNCGSQAPELDGDSSCFDESLEWCHTPDEDEDLFECTVAAFEKLAKPSKEIKRLKPPDEPLIIRQDTGELADINLFDLLPHKLANSLSLVKENLPYDSLCVLVSFLTGVASMLRLGTTVTGNEMTDYRVPVNLYTILRAPSGRKKSPLQKLFVEQPASDVMLRVAQENDRIIRAYQDECRSKKANDKPPQPDLLDIRVNDYTGEAFVKALGTLDERGRAVLVLREEIAGLFQSLNAYKSGKGADEQQLLELYDGNGFKSLRVGDKGRSFSRAAVNIYGTIQPDVLDALLRNGDASGLWARFCFAAMPDMTKKLPTRIEPEKLIAFKNAQQFLKNVVSAVFELKAINYRLDPDATEVFSDYELKKQEDALATKVSAQAALYGKAAGKVLRFAGLLHILEIVVNGHVQVDLISKQTLQKAIDLVDRLDSWALAYHAKLAGITRQSLNALERRVHTLAYKSQSGMSWTEIRNKMSSDEKSGKSAEDAEAAMCKLVALGLGEVSKGPNGGLRYKALKPIDG